MLRSYWQTTRPLNDNSGKPDDPKQEYIQVDEIEEATLVGSLLPSGKHAPVIDIDLPCELVASTTPGHFHLYIDKAISWDRYEDILKALSAAEIVEAGYYGAARKNKQTFVRKPGLKKSNF